MVIKTKTKEALEKINTKNLLALYKAERQRNFSFRAANTCECCGELMADIYGNKNDYSEFRKEEKQREDYLELIKSVLNTREHVSRKSVSAKKRIKK